MLNPAAAVVSTGSILSRFASKIVGIDLGTTHCCVALNGEVLRDQGGFATIPSVVHFPEGAATPVVGRLAQEQGAEKPDSMVTASKRLIGRRFNDPMVQQLRKMVPFAISPAPNGDAWVSVHGKQYSPSQIGGFLLSQVKQNAERVLGEPITDAVITCPAYFNDSQRTATKDAGTLAGLKVRRLVNEPTAACLAYGIGKQGNKNVAVFDLGGGTFDVSILNVSDGIFKVRATNGDTFLGGEDFDNALVAHFLKQIQEKHHKDLSGHRKAMQRLRQAVEEAKINLTAGQSAEIDMSVFLPPETPGADPVPFRFQSTLSRAELENLTRHLVQKTLPPCQKCLKDAGLKPSQLNEVVLIGGMTRMPLVVQTVRNFFGREPFAGINPEWAVAQGASIQASILSKGAGAGDGASKVVLMDVTPLSLGIEVYGGAFSRVVPRNTSIPASISQEFTNVQDYAPSIEVKIYQGEREMAADNVPLGNLELLIEPKPKGQSRITVKFDIDANGILHVSARDAASGQEQKVQINARGGLSEDEIKKMLSAAAENAANDRRKLELASLLVRAEEKLAVAGTGLTLGQKDLKEDVRKEVADAMRETRAAMTVRSLESLRSSLNKLNQAVQKMGIWANPPNLVPPPPPASGSSSASSSASSTAAPESSTSPK